MVEAAIDSGDTAWVLVASAMVLLMTPGLAFFYGGLVRSQNILNTIMMSVISMGVTGVLWTLLGFTLAFGEGYWLGDLKFWGLIGLHGHVWPGTRIPGLVYAVFQMTFAIIGGAIISGSVVERIRFSAYVALISLYCLLIHAPLAHWVWGGGWIQELGALDFAGGTVVHISSGTSGLVASLVLGKRTGLNPAGRAPHSMPMVVLGAALLWFGWTGFNGGSALAADFQAADALATTLNAAAAGLVTRLFVERVFYKRPTTLGAMSGAVAGLVAITPGAGYVSALSSLAIGSIGALSCMGASLLLERWHSLDDSLDAFGLHGVGGIVGGILTGVFARQGGLMHFDAGCGRLLGAQLVSIVGALGYSALMTFVILRFLQSVMEIRVSAADEKEGLDIHQHTEAAYSSWLGSRQNLQELAGAGESDEESFEASEDTR